MSKASKTEKFIFNLTINLDAIYREFEFIQKIHLGYDKVEKSVTFLDEHKNKHHGHISFSQGSQHCFWDRHPFEWQGIMCPLERVYESSLHTYKSDINGANYIIQDTLSTDTSYYRSDGYFCSEECRLAYIEDNLHNPKFIDAKNLAFGIAGKKCNPAPSWRLLQVYGGSYTIDKFRELFCNKTFELEAVLTKPLFYVYSEHYHF